MKKIIALSMATTILFSTVGAATVEATEVKTVQKKENRYHQVKIKTEKMYLNDGKQAKVDMLQPQNLTANKALQKQIKEDIADLIAFKSQRDFTNYKKENGAKSRIKATYEIKANKDMNLSIRVEMYFENGDIENTVYKGAFNLNYIKNKKGKNKAWFIEDHLKNEADFKKYVRKETKKKFGISAEYPDYSITPYYLKENGDVVIVFTGGVLERRWQDYYFLTVPKKYFK